MRTPELVITTEPTPGELQYLEHRLYEFNSTATGITDGEWRPHVPPTPVTVRQGLVLRPRVRPSL